MTARITLNCDMGEGFALYRFANDAELMPLIDLANVACGFHAADPSVMRATVRLAKQHGVKVGSHPSLPDLQGFGRRAMAMRPDEVTDLVTYQTGALVAFLQAENMPLHHVKPHGALYGMAARDPAIAAAVAQAVKPFGVPLLGMAGTAHDSYAAQGVPMVAEFYADLDYDENGALILSRVHDAVDPVAARERMMRAIKEGKVKNNAGRDIPMKTESVCVHSDTPNAAAIAAELSRALRA